jgi:hypothetical protein
MEENSPAGFLTMPIDRNAEDERKARIEAMLAQVQRDVMRARRALKGSESALDRLSRQTAVVKVRKKTRQLRKPRVSKKCRSR